MCHGVRMSKDSSSARPARWAVFSSLLVIAAFQSRTLGATVRATVSARETQVGVPVVLSVVIKELETYDPPVLPEIPDVRIRSRGAPSRESQTTVINGVVKNSNSLTYEFELVPSREGNFTIPALEVKADGKIQKTEPIQVIVSRGETDDLLFVDVKGSRGKLYVGENVHVNLQIWLRPFVDRRYGKLNEQSMFSCIDRNATQWGAFLDTLQEMARRGESPRVREEVRKDTKGQDRGYYVYEFGKTIRADREGLLPMGDVNIVVTYPTQLGRSSDLFAMGNLVMIGSRTLSGRAKVEPIRVLPIPTEGRPAWYNGAVGQYKIRAEAKPTEVAVGDPITLTLTVNGTGELRELLAPPLARLTDLTAHFKLPTDPLAGEVTGDGKKFAVSLRATSEAVTEIPPIPFAYFDPESEQFVTVRSAPVPLKVRPADKLAMSQIVEAGGQHAAQANQLTESSGGILANYTGMDEVLTQQGFTPNALLALALVAPPVAFFASFVARRRSERLRTDTGFARRRSARRTALHHLHEAAGKPVRESAALVAAAVSGYLADRCNLPSGGLTRAYVIEQLTARSVQSGTVSRVDGLLALCEGAHYGASAVTTSAEWVQEAKACIDLLERERSLG